MKKLFFCFSLFTTILTQVFANSCQKKPIDSSDYSWPMVRGAKISNDGKYCFYFTSTDPNSLLGSLNIAGINAKLLLTFSNVYIRDASFTNKGDNLIFQNAGDSVGIICMRLKKISYIKDVKSYRLIDNEDSSYCLVERKSAPGEIMVSTIGVNHNFNLHSVQSYSISPSGEKLIFDAVLSDSQHKHQLSEIDLSKNNVRVIWTGFKVFSATYNHTGDNIAFIGQQGSNDSPSIYIADRTLNATKIDCKNFGDSLKLDPTFVSFSPNDCGLYYNVKKNKKSITPLQTKTAVEIWSYSSLFLPFQQTEELSKDFNSKMTFHWYYSFGTNSALILDSGNTILYSGSKGTNYAITLSQYYPDRFYNKKLQPSFYLIDLKRNTRIEFLKNENLYGGIYFSPNEKYIVWFSTDNLAYFCYDVSVGNVVNLSKKVKSFLYDEQEYKVGRKIPFGVAGWNDNGNSIIIYDRYDAWCLDLTGKKPPRNITLGFGEKSKIVFGFIEGNGATDLPVFDFALNEYVITAFETATKRSGYYKLDGKYTKLECLGFYNSAHYISNSGFSRPRVGRTGFEEFASPSLIPIKSKFSDNWIIEKMSSSESPNYFITKNFREFHQISFIEPEKKVNWLNSRLITWKLSSGITLQGILYTPENIDSSAKYPCIITYYEKRSDQLNEFLRPSYSDSRIDIPTFVSNGYVVFVPDIKFDQGHNGKSVLSAIKSCRTVLNKFKFIDQAKIGLQGHSFGGWVTNYLVTHTGNFAAACEASGVSDQISSYGQLGGNGARQELYEVTSQGSPYGVGVTPWTHADLYIENSPIFSIGQVTVPLLMMHGDKDRSVPFIQGVEFFLALRRAGKKAWLLEYLNAEHTLYANDAKDYTIRLTQFFDHYLKNAPAPVWMTQGIPAKLKGIETGYAYDPSGNCGKDCKVCKYWNEKFKKDSAACWKEIEERKEKEHWE